MGLFDAIFGLFTKPFENAKELASEKRQWEREKAMFNMQAQFQKDMAEQNQNYALESMNKSQGFQKEMNAINFEQQNQMFDKTAEYMSVGAQKRRLEAEGMNPALAYGLTGGGGQSSSGGGSGAGAIAGSGSGSVSPQTQAVMMGLQAKAIESQTKVNLATVAEKVANAAKTREEAKNEKEERPNIKAEGGRIKAATDLLLKQGITENEKAKLTKLEQGIAIAQEQLTWQNWEQMRQQQYTLAQQYEELGETIKNLKIENHIKEEAAENIIKGYWMNLQTQWQQVIESRSRVKLNEEQRNVLEATVRDIESTINNRNLTEEQRRKEIDKHIDQMSESIEYMKQDNMRKWIYGGIDSAVDVVNTVNPMGQKPIKVRGFGGN